MYAIRSYYVTNVYVWVVLLVTVGYGVVGFVDDYRKVKLKNSDGISPRQKMFWQLLRNNFV